MKTKFLISMLVVECWMLNVSSLLSQEAVNITNLPVAVTISTNDMLLVSSNGATGRSRQFPLYSLPGLLQSLGIGFATTNDVGVATNGLASTNYVNNATNGLASTNYVNTATNSLASTNYVNNATNGLASTNYVNTATNGLASTNYVNTATNGLASTNYVNTATNGLASTNYVNTATNGLASTNYVNTATNGLASTNYVNTATNGLASTNYVNTATNGLASTNYATLASTNGPNLAPGSGITITTNTGNGKITWTITAGFDTNGLASSNAITAAVAGLQTYDAPAAERFGHIFKQWRTEQTLFTNGVGGAQDFQKIVGPSLGYLKDKQAIYWASYDAGWTGRIFAAYGDTLSGFQKHPTPILSPTVGQWDGGHLGSARLFQDGNTNYLYYFAGTNYGTFEPIPHQIGVAYSTDGTNFTKYSGNPILTNGPASSDSYTLYTLCVLKHGATYYGFYNAADDFLHSERIHLATAPSPLGPWTKYSGNPVFAITNGTYYINSDFSVFKLKGDGGWGALYWHFNNLDAQYEIATAYSTNLTNWTHSGFITNAGARIAGTGPWFFDEAGPNMIAPNLNQDALIHYRPVPVVNEVARWRSNHLSGSNHFSGEFNVSGRQYRTPADNNANRVRWDVPASWYLTNADFAAVGATIANANQWTLQTITNTAATNIYYTPGFNFYLLNAAIVTNRIPILTNAVAWIEWRTDAATNISAHVMAGYGIPPASSGGGGGGGDALTSNPLSQFAATTSAQFAGVINDEAGTAGQVVLSVSPTITTPTLSGNTTAGTINNTTIPTAATLVKASDTINALTSASSATYRGKITDPTGTGAAVFAVGATLSSPAIVTPSISGATVSGISTFGGTNNFTGVASFAEFAVTNLTPGSFVVADSNFKLISTLDGGALGNLNASAFSSGTLPLAVMPLQFRSSVNVSNIDWRYDQVSAVVSASWTVTNSPDGVGIPNSWQSLRMIITNTSSSYATGTVTVPIVWDQENSRVSQTIFFPPTNVSYIRFWTDGVTNIHAMWETFEPARSVLSAAYRLITNAWAGPTNILYMTNGAQHFTASGNCAITNIFETSATENRYVELTISNSTASAITVYTTDLNAKALGSSTTNALVIAAAKEGTLWYRTRARWRTNYVTSAEQ